MLAGAAFVGFIPTRSLDAARAFYEGVLGLRVAAADPYALVIDANGTTLRVTAVEDFVQQTFTIAGWQVADIAASVATLTARGVNFLRYQGMTQDDLGIWTTPGGEQVAWFHDSDGNVLSLTSLGGATPEG